MAISHEYRPPFGLEEYDNRNGAPPEGWSNLVSGQPVATRAQDAYNRTAAKVRRL